MVNYGERARQLRQERAAEARRLRDQGLSLREIGRELGVDFATVRNDLNGGDMNTLIRNEAQRALDRLTDRARQYGLTQPEETE